MRTLYHFPLSPFCRTVRLALAEKGLPFRETVERDYEKRPEYTALHPDGTVPVLIEENGFIIPEDPVILEYLEEAYPDPGLLGRTLGERVETRRLLTRFNRKFYQEVTLNIVGEKHRDKMTGSRLKKGPDAAKLREGYTYLKAHLTYMTGLIESRRSLSGTAGLSLADLAAAAHLSVLDFTGEIDWSTAPVVKEWYACMKSRPPFRSLLQDHVTGIIPPPYYTALDF